jgi:hypothetical protein
MVWYVALIAVLNLALGYALALYLNKSRAGRRSATNAATSDELYGDDEFESDDFYEEAADEAELEAAAVG